VNILYLYKETINYILRICVPSTLRVVAQHIEVLTVRLDLTYDYQSILLFMIGFTILSGLRFYVNESREIYYSVDSN